MFYVVPSPSLPPSLHQPLKSDFTLELEISLASSRRLKNVKSLGNKVGVPGVPPPHPPPKEWERVEDVGLQGKRAADIGGGGGRCKEEAGAGLESRERRKLTAQSGLGTWVWMNVAGCVIGCQRDSETAFSYLPTEEMGCIGNRLSFPVQN